MTRVRVERAVEGAWCACYDRADVARTEIHVHPLRDLVAHQLDQDACVCGPTPEVIVRVDQDLPDATVWVHHALGGRELTEDTR